MQLGAQRSPENAARKAKACQPPPPPRPWSARALTSLAPGAGEARHEQGGAAATQRPLHRRVPGEAEGNGGGRPSRPPFRPSAPARPRGLTVAARVASLWSSPCGSKTSLAPGSRGPGRGHSGRPGGGEQSLRRRPHPAPFPELHPRAHLVQEAEPLEGLAVLHLARHRHRLPSAATTRRAQSLLGSVVSETTASSVPKPRPHAHAGPHGKCSLGHRLARS